MRKQKASLLVLLTLLFAVFTLGFFLGRNGQKSEISVSVSDKIMTMPPETVQVTPSIQKAETVFPISINRAGKEELMTLPGVGEVLAERIIVYRMANGPFSTEAELLNVEGIGRKKLEEMMDFIVIGG